MLTSIAIPKQFYMGLVDLNEPINKKPPANLAYILRFVWIQ